VDRFGERQEGKTVIGGTACFLEGTVKVHLKESEYRFENWIYLAQHRGTCLIVLNIVQTVKIQEVEYIYIYIYIYIFDPYIYVYIYIYIYV
jgi:hypothetical protein